LITRTTWREEYIEEFVVEKHNGQITQESLDTKFHRREEYTFNNLTSKLENNL